ncbi:ABC transporter [Bacillus sp. F19]|nr:ABC transporter [Bacillus sp. F19]
MVKGGIITDKKLLEIFVRWEDKLADDEWYFSNSFETITRDMSSDVAFNYIPNVVDVLIKLEDDYLIWETLYFLIELYIIADTTQIHPMLEEKWSVLKSHIKYYSDSNSTPLQELIRHLRITE